MRASIVIPTFNRKETLRQTLRACSEQDYACEVIVVDDASTDGTAEMVRNEFPNIRYFRQEKNRGPAAARNIGIQEAGGEIVVFTDDDCLPPRDFVSRLVDGYRRYPHVVGVGGYQEAPDEILSTNEIAAYERYMSTVLYSQGREERIGGFDCPCGGTNSMSYLRQIMVDVCGFDEAFPVAAGEDADLKWRICAQGYKLLYVPVKVVHLQKYTWSEFRRQQIRHGVGDIYFSRKHSKPTLKHRVALRVIKRALKFLPDATRMPSKIAWVKMWSGIYECYGQWTELSKLEKSNRGKA